MLDKLRLRILDYIKQQNLNYIIVRDEEDLFMVDLFGGDMSAFKYSFILNKSTPRWNNCGFIGVNEDEFRPMTQEGLDELFEIANECIEHGFSLSVIKDNQIIQVYQAIETPSDSEETNKNFIVSFLKNNNLIENDFDVIEYKNFKNDKSFEIEREELERM